MGIDGAITGIRVLAAAAGFVTLTGPGVATACAPSGWLPMLTPALGCLELKALEEGRIDVHSNCPDEVELIPDECDDSCSGALRVASHGAARLMLPDAPKDNERRVFEYKTAEQTGTLVFTYELNLCDGESGNCAVAVPRGNPSGARLGAACAFLMVLGYRLRRLSRSLCPKQR